MALPRLDDDDDDEPTPKEVQAVLRELLLEDAPARPHATQRKHAPAAAPTAPASAALSAPARSAQASAFQTRGTSLGPGIVGIVGARAEAYQREASLAFERGDADKGNWWLTKNVELSQALGRVLHDFPPPNAMHSQAAETSPSGPSTAASLHSLSKDDIEGMVSARVVQSVLDQARCRGPIHSLLVPLMVRHSPLSCLGSPKALRYAGVWARRDLA